MSGGALPGRTSAWNNGVRVKADTSTLKLASVGLAVASFSGVDSAQQACARFGWKVDITCKPDRERG